MSLLGDSWRRSADPTVSRDPEVRRLVAELRVLGTTVPAPDATFRAELRAQLVAVAPRLIAESGGSATDTVAPVLPAAERRAERSGRASGARSWRPTTAPAHAPSARGALAFSLRRVALGSTIMLVALLSLLSVGVMMSRDALPGDALYGLKRASENVQLALDSSSQEPKDLLHFAALRVDEARQLVARSQATAAGEGAHAGRIDEQTLSYVSGNLTSSNDDVIRASRMLTSQAVRSSSASPLAALTSWTPGQLRQLKDLQAALGGTSVSSQIQRATQLVTSADLRAKQLSGTVGCHCLSGTGSDSLGPKPCTSCTGGAPGGVPPATVTGSVPPSLATTGAAPGTATGTSPGSTSGTQPERSSAPRVGPLAPIGGILTGVPGLLPTTLPTTNPVAVTSCSLTVTLGGLHLDLPLCTSTSASPTP